MPGPEKISGEHLREKTPISQKLFQNIKEKRILPHSLYEASIILSLKPDKNKKTTDPFLSCTQIKNYWHIFNKLNPTIYKKDNK